MMRFIGALVAVLATFSIVPIANAQTVSSIGGPRELPQPGYTGQQYVDSRGCVFLKAGFGGQTTWVPRVDARRKPICGLPPTYAKVNIEIAEEEPITAPTPAPATPVAAAPAAATRAPAKTAAVDPATYTPAPYTPPVARTVKAAPTATPTPAPVVAASRATAPVPYTDTAPASTYETARSGPGPGKIGCYTSAPVAEVVRLRDGGTAVVCTKGDGGLSGWRPPIYPAGSPVGAALSGPQTRHANAPTARAAADPGRLAVAKSSRATTQVAAATVPKPPKGYKLAWTDDRLNPNRAKGTAAGQAAQDQVWTRDVPAKAVVGQPTGEGVVVSTKSASAKQPATTVAVQGALVQVGTFGVAANADGAAARLAALGLPVAKGKTTKGGKTLQIVFAGPFASAAAAQSALSTARKAGFSDAFLR